MGTKITEKTLTTGQRSALVNSWWEPQWRRDFTEGQVIDIFEPLCQLGLMDYDYELDAYVRSKDGHELLKSWGFTR